MARKPIANDQAAAAAADALLSGEAAKGNVQTLAPELFKDPPKGVTMTDVAGEYPPALTSIQPTPPKSEIFEMDMATMAKSLSSNGGLDIRLGNVAQWTPEQREEARRWIVQKWDRATRPKFLDAYAKAMGAEVHQALTAPPIPSKPAVETLERNLRASIAEEKKLEPLSSADRYDATLPQRREEAAAKMVQAVQQHTVGGTPPPLFVNANKGPKVSPDFARIIETLYASDAFKDYEDLEKNLEVGEDRGDYLTLRERLDKAQVRRGRAYQLLLGAKLELFNWERDAEATTAAMRNTAHDELQAEKDNGARNKAITDADVVARIAQRFPNEYRTQETTRHKLKGAVAAIESFVDRWTAKAFDLRCLLETLRK